MEVYFFNRFVGDRAWDIFRVQLVICTLKNRFGGYSYSQKPVFFRVRAHVAFPRSCLESLIGCFNV